MVERILPEQPEFPGAAALDHWFVNLHKMQIFGACPPSAEGALAERLAQDIMDIPGRVKLPLQPGYAVFDSLTWTARLVDRA